MRRITLLFVVALFLLVMGPSFAAGSMTDAEASVMIDNQIRAGVLEDPACIYMEQQGANEAQITETHRRYRLQEGIDNGPSSNG